MLTHRPKLEHLLVTELQQTANDVRPCFVPEDVYKRGDHHVEFASFSNFPYPLSHSSLSSTVNGLI